MQEIKLTTENSDTVHVDSVDVSKGVYALRHSDKRLAYLRVGAEKTWMYYADNGDLENYKCLLDAVEICGYYDFFTIPDNRRIVTEKPLTVEPNSIIGIDYADGTKGWIVCLGGVYHAISFEQKTNIPNQHIATKSTINILIDALLTIGGNRLFLFAAYDDEWAAWLTKK